MGGALAAEASAAGYEVTIVDVSAELIERVRADGLIVDSGAEPLHASVPITQDPASVGPVDITVVFVKAQHTRSAADVVAALLGPETLAVTLQNGWGNADVLASVLPPEQLVMGVTYHSCSVVGPGHVRHTGRGPTVVGPYLPAAGTAGAHRVAEFLSGAGWEATATTEVRTEIWKKLVLNAATLPTAALSGLPAGALGASGPLLELVDELAAEAVAVARAQGLKVDLAERVERIHAVLAGAGSGKASMLQDVEARRKTEVETVNGAVVRTGAEVGVPTPLNRAMLALINGVERSWQQRVVNA
jgi:2-dehydropantoate 2-reductase